MRQKEIVQRLGHWSSFSFQHECLEMQPVVGAPKKNAYPLTLGIHDPMGWRVELALR